MTFNKKRIISTLCAVIMVLVWCIVPSPAQRVSAADDDADVYALDIEFGSLSFTYDYGVWDVNDMRYEAAGTSINPAEGTVAGYPGWYGFDGTANKITITNNSTLEQHDITVSLSYRDLNDSDIAAAHEGSVLQKVTGVNMKLNDGSGWSGTLNSYEKTIEAGDDTTVYVHFSGEPRLVEGGSKYFSNAMNPVGIIVVRIEDWK